MESFANALELIFDNVFIYEMGTNAFEELFVAFCASLPIMSCILIPLLVLRLIIGFIG